MIKKLNILILDADKTSCVEMREFLQNAGFFVQSAHTAAKGYLALKKRSYDILVLDIGLPEVNGLEVLKECKSQYPDLEVIVISGYGDMDSVIQAMRLGALDFLRKPLRQNDLLLALERSQKIPLYDRIMLLRSEKTSLPARSLMGDLLKNATGSPS